MQLVLPPPSLPVLPVFTDVFTGFQFSQHGVLYGDQNRHQHSFALLVQEKIQLFLHSQ